MTAPFVSIVVSTRNRAESLRVALRSHELMASATPWELVVVDNGSTDTTARVLEEFRSATPISVRVVSQPLPGLSRARNSGWRAAAGSVIAFTDDDCYPQPDFVTRIAERFAIPSIDYLGGRILLHDPEDAPVTTQTSTTPVTIAPGSFVRAGLIQGANMAARRSVLETVGGFDEMLGAGTPFPCEDLDFVCRASAAGFQGAYDPGPVVMHHHRRRTREQVRALTVGYDIGRGAYYAKCMLDPRLRRPAWKGWLELLRYNLAASRTSLRSALRIGYELYGALAYLVRRAGRVLLGRR